MGELRAPDPTLTALGAESVKLGLGPLPPIAHRHGGCVPETRRVMRAEYARWFAVPCRECFPDAPPPGTWFSGHALVQGQEVPTQTTEDPHLAWQVPDTEGASR